MSYAQQSGSAGRSQRPDPAEMQKQLFAKLDSDGSGSVDATELQSALDAMAKNGGQAGSVSASDMLSQLDADKSGGISADEFSQALQSQRPPPPPQMSTADFAHARAGGQGDPLMSLDSDQDGAVSSSEFGITDSSDDSMKSFFKAVDADGDGKITSAESDAFKEKMQAQMQSARDGGDSSDSSSGSGFTRQDYSMLAAMANAHYGAVGSGAVVDTSQRLAVAA